MDEPSVQDIINGFRSMPGTVEERASALAFYLSPGDRTCAVVDHIEGSIAHIVRLTLIEDFETFRMKGYMGDLYREIRERITVEMNPTMPLELKCEVV